MAQEVTAPYYCRKCGTYIQGRAEYCILCYSQMHRPCPNCMRQGMAGKYRVKKKSPLGGRREGPRVPVACAICKNQRYILIDENEEIVG